jgi:hypothetical protein
MDVHKNFATSLVATAPSPATTGTSLVVTGGEGSRFPAVPFNAVIAPAGAAATPANAEVVRVTAISTDTFTITRTQESSSARTVIVGDRIYAGPTVKSLTDIEVVDAAAATGSLRTLSQGPASAASHIEAVQLGTGALSPTGVTFQNFTRYMPAVSTIALTSGTVKLVAIYLPINYTVTSLSFISGATALVSGTSPHLWFALFDNSRNLLRQTTDDTAPTWANNTLKTVNLSSTFLTTYTGTHYVGVMVVAGGGGTQPTLAGVDTLVVHLIGKAPIMGGNSSTGLTATAPNPAAAITASSPLPWCGIA